MIEELPELLTRNTEILEECERLLREERESDDQLRAQFKEKWTRTASEKLTGAFNSNAQKYRTIITNAKDADKIVREKFEFHQEWIELLSQGSNLMESKIPSASGSQVQNSPNVAKLKQLCEDVETLKAERQAIEVEFKGTNPDMKNIFINSHGSGNLNEAEMSQETLNRAFGPLINQVEDSLKRQENILKEMSQFNEKFTQEKGGNPGENGRDEMLKKLAAAHDAFFELQKHLQEGTKFYNDLTQLLVNFQGKVSDYCFARKTEKDENMKDLTATMSQMNVNKIEAPPHHAPAGGDKSPTRPPRAKDPPARPPPPQIDSTPALAPTPANAPASAPASAPAVSAPNPYAGAPVPPANNPYAGAPQYPPAGAPYGGAPAPLPYPTQPNMPMPYQAYPYPPQQQFYPPQGQPPAYYPPQQYYPPPPGGQQPYYPPAPPQNPGQQPQWR